MFAAKKMMVLALVGLGAVGCASVSLPTAEVERYESSVRLAKAIGAFDLQADRNHRGAFGMSEAKEHLVLASDQMEVARSMASSGDARSVLLVARAQSDVDLALGLAREAAIHNHVAAELADSGAVATGTHP